MRQLLVFCLLSAALALSCKKAAQPADPATPPAAYQPVPYALSYPAGFPEMQLPKENPLTVQGVALGRKLFYDPILSGNGTLSCASCHKQSAAFTDSLNAFSTGIDQLKGTRNSMPLFNLGYQRNFFWDGGASDLESQVIGPIQNPVELHQDLATCLARLQASPEYPELFYQAFGTRTISSLMLMQAIAQFERTLLSGSSRYDRYTQGRETLTAEESEGLALFQDPQKGDCSHCHMPGATFSDFEFRNNGVDSIYSDPGRYRITLNPADSGRFKTPTLRNIALTAPYMHDGRFATLEECLHHYNSGFRYSKSLDPNIRQAVKGRMTEPEMQKIIAFLKTLSDEEFTRDRRFAKP